METNQQNLPITRMIEVTYLNGDVVAETKHEKLLITGKGIMIVDDKGNESYKCWNSFLKYFSHLRTLESTCKLTASLVKHYEEV